MSEQTEVNTAEQDAAKAAEATSKAQAAEAAKAAKAAEKAAAKEAKAAEKAAKEAEKAAAKQAKLDAAEAEKAAKQKAIDDKAAAVAAAKAAKEATRQPEQNGIRRPGPTGLCGRVWALADALSAALNQATPIANLLEAGIAEGLNPSNIRVEYARWKKFHGLSGRIALPKVEAPAEAAAPTA